MYKMNYSLMNQLHQNKQHPPFRYSNVLWDSMFRQNQPENQPYYDLSRVEWHGHHHKYLNFCSCTFYDMALGLTFIIEADTVKKAYKRLNGHVRRLYKPKSY